MDLLIYFVVGIVQDFAFTLNMRYIAKDDAWLSALTSFITTVISLGVLYSILTRLNENRSIIAILVYALGISFGTLIAMKIKIKK